jgi:ketosteroid isomerase-like protein
MRCSKSRLTTPRCAHKVLKAITIVATLAGFLSATAPAAESALTDDRAAIEALNARYLAALDEHDTAALRDTFARDGVLLSEAGTERGNEIGRFLHAAAVHDSQRSSGPESRISHRNAANIVLEVNGAAARGRVTWYEVVRESSPGESSGARPTRLGAYGYFEDDYVKTGGQWRFARRRVFDEMRADLAASTERPTKSFGPPAAVGDSYADNRAAIEDLQARYLYAMNWFDKEAYADVFTANGSVYMGTRVESGRDAIYTVITDFREIIWGHATGRDQGLRLPATRHAISNVVIDIHGSTARAWGYWNTLQNDNLQRSAEVGNFGSYEDELLKTGGRWFFTSRKVFNQMKPDRVAPDVLPFSATLRTLLPESASETDDLAVIKNLQARYAFALDWQNPAALAATFTEDGVLVLPTGDVRGRDALRRYVVDTRVAQRSKAAREALWDFTTRHVFSNPLVTIDGDHAVARAYWTRYSNDGPLRKPYVDGFGICEDRLIKVDGEWLFASRKFMPPSAAIGRSAP